MDLKDFVKETIAGIVDATTELQEIYEEKGVVVNPPVSVQERDLYEENNADHTYRRVETIEFDVAVTASSETGGGAKAGLRILSAEAGLDGKRSHSSEEISRVKFSVPISLPPSKAEGDNRQARDENRRKSDEAIAASRKRGSKGSWMA
ncbi:trypco2 family protein [uncultured Roseobacter sp.]|uniref:trypco2 family protein n=1 Tax=uncultured Roseobacter sp. TaxID=114847 RepID=UPI002639B85F|nr:trypco2 family protein [uncultured Roseobacter sp.]